MCRFCDNLIDKVNDALDFEDGRLKDWSSSVWNSEENTKTYIDMIGGHLATHRLNVEHWRKVKEARNS